VYLRSFNYVAPSHAALVLHKPVHVSTG